MTLQEFADRRRLRIRLGEDREPIILGKRGHIYEHDAETLGLLLEYPTARRWNWARRKLEAAGFTIWQDGDQEGSALFDPENAAQVRLAFRLAGVKTRRSPSAAQLAALEKARKSAKLLQEAPTPCAGGGFAP